MKLSFCLFWICNKNYPKQASYAWEIIQRNFFGISGTETVRGEKKDKFGINKFSKLSIEIKKIKEEDNSI